MGINRTDECESALLAALSRAQGPLIEIMRNPKIITTCATLASITQAAIECEEDRRQVRKLGVAARETLLPPSHPNHLAPH